MEAEKLESICKEITEIIFKHKDSWEKQYLWISYLLHAQGALKNSISELKKQPWEVKRPPVGER
jgi:hypothetical protein